RVVSLGFEEQLVALRCREFHDLVFDRRAIARTARSDGAAVHGRTADVFLDDPLAGLPEERDPARELLRMAGPAASPARLSPEVRPGIVELLDLAFLAFEAREVHRPAVDSRRRARLEARDGESHLVQLL